LGRSSRRVVMATVVGKPGRFLSQEVERKEHRLLTVIIAAVGTLEFLLGVALGLFVGNWRRWGWIALLVVVAMGLFIYAAMKAAERRVDRLQRELRDLLRGLRGEDLVGYRLEGLPEEFRVVHDLATEAGNVDHVVIGPTGVFALDTKTWRGTVASDGNGELLLNGTPPDKPYVHQFVGRVMGIKDKLKVLARGIDPYLQAVFVFTSAYVDAKWGTTGKVHCVRDEQLYDYIAKSKAGRKLMPSEVETLSRAFKALASMEAGFDGSGEAKKSPGGGHANAA